MNEKERKIIILKIINKSRGLEKPEILRKWLVLSLYNVEGLNNQ